MKHTTKINRLLLLSFVSIASCIEPIDFELTQIEPVPVVNCFITESSEVELFLSESYSITEEPPDPIKNAEIIITSGSNVVYELAYDSGYRYVGAFSLAPDNYELKVIIPDGGTLVASTVIPQKFYPQSASVEFPAGVDEYGDPIAQYKIALADDGAEDNYFEMFLFDLNIDKSAIDYVSTEFLAENDPIMLAEGLDGFRNTSFIFSDNLFSGETYEITIRELPIGYGAELPPFVDQLEAGTSYVHLRHSSQEYYEFRKSWVRHQFHQQIEPAIFSSGFTFGDISEFLFKGTVEPLQSNVKNGVGIFAGYNDVFFESERILNNAE